MLLANIRKAITTAAGFVLAAFFIGVAQAEPDPQMDVWVLLDGFRIQMTFVPTTAKLIDVIVASKPPKLVLHVCTLTPQRVLKQVLKDLEGIPPNEPEIVQSGRQVLQCSFPTDRERGGVGA